MANDAAHDSSSDADVPLCVDLDGTLIRSDLLVESTLDLIRRNPLYVFAIIYWLILGRATLKQEIAARSDIDVSRLPYEPRVTAWLRELDARQPLILCTGSDEKYARAVAANLGGFANVFASDGKVNLSGERKAQALVARFGEQGFDYAGNAAADLSVWRHARRAIVVNAAPSVAHRAAQLGNMEREFARPVPYWRAWLKELRLHQWLKNVLLFLPLLAAHHFLDMQAIKLTLIAFVSFGLCASGVYVLNDLLDLAADRAHPRKRLRPFAAGTLPLAQGLVVSPLLTLAAFALAFTVSDKFTAVLLTYYLLTLLYSFALKRVAILDTVALAALYSVRIVAGAVAASVVLSFWLLAFSMFLFLSLAMVKRYTELQTVAEVGRTHSAGRGYEIDDLDLIQSLGSASGYLSVLVLALYINSTASEVLYRHQQVLWLLCPLLLYWISRVWLKTHRGQMHDDPVVFALTDRVSQIVLALCAIVIALAI